MFYTVGVAGVSTGVSTTGVSTTGVDSTTGVSTDADSTTGTTGVTISTHERVSSCHVNILPSTTGIGVGGFQRYVVVSLVHEAKGCGGAKPVPSHV